MAQEDFAFEPSLLAEQIIQGDLDSAIFDDVDESDTPRAANFLEWCIDKSFLNIEPFPRQIQIAAQLFQDICPVCSDPKTMNNMFDQSVTELMDRVQFLRFGVCPKCHKNRIELEKEGKFQYEFPNEVAVNAGQRSGKSALVAMLATYILHRYLCLPNPQRFFALLPGYPLAMTFTAITAGQASDLLWMPFKSWYDSSPWFKDYHAMLKYYENKLSVEILHIKPTFFLYRHKNLTGFVESPDKRKLRGKTRFCAACDEIGWFDADAESKKITVSAEETYTSLVRSLQTVRAAADKLRKIRNLVDVPNAYMLNISSPSSINDKINRLVKDAQFNKRIVAHHYSTWEFNPRMPFDSLRDEFKKSKDKAWRDFGAMPPMATSAFIGEENVIDKVSVVPDNNASISYRKKIIKDDFGDNTLYIEVAIKKQDKMTPRLLAIDTGYSGNSFACALMRYDRPRLKLIVEKIFEATPEDDTPVNFNQMYLKCILPICQALNIKIAVYDQWQSIDLAQRLKDDRFYAERYSLTYEDFVSFRDHFMGEEIHIPKPEIPLKTLRDSREDILTIMKDKPNLYLCYQLLTVRELGKKVTKPMYGSDDAFRSVVLGATFIFDPKLRKQFESSRGFSGNRLGGGNISGISFPRTIGGAVGISRSGGSAPTSSGLVLRRNPY